MVELHDQDQHINKLSFSLWFQRVRVHHGGEVCQQGQGAESLQPQLQSCPSKLEMGSGYVISKPDLSDIFPPSRLYQLNLPKQAKQHHGDSALAGCYNEEKRRNRQTRFRHGALVRRVQCSGCREVGSCDPRRDGANVFIFKEKCTQYLGLESHACNYVKWF